MKRVPADAPRCRVTRSRLADDAACLVRLAVYRSLLPHVLRPGLRVPRPGGAADGSRLWLACRMAQMLAGALPGRRIHVVADAAYAGEELKKLPPGVTWTTRLRKDAALCELPPARTGRRGRPRAKGVRLPSLDVLARRAAFGPVTVTRYGKTATIHAEAITCLWHGVFGPRPGTRPRPSRPPRTWPPSSAASSSPQDLRQLAPTSQHPKKSESSAWPGKTSPHDRESRVTQRPLLVLPGSSARPPSASSKIIPYISRAVPGSLMPAAVRPALSSPAQLRM